MTLEYSEDESRWMTLDEWLLDYGFSIDDSRWTISDGLLLMNDSRKTTLNLIDGSESRPSRPDQSRGQYKIRVFIGFVNVDRRLIQGFRW